MNVANYGWWKGWGRGCLCGDGGGMGPLFSSKKESLKTLGTGLS